MDAVPQAEPAADPTDGGALLLQSRYEVRDELMRCRFSTLFNCIDTETWTPLVLRRLHAPHAISQEARDEAHIQFLREGHVLRRLVHRNLPRVLDHFEEAGAFYIVMEPFEGFTPDYVIQHLSGPPDEPLLRGWMDQVAAALEYLHGQNPPIVYRDLRPQTILITSHGVVKLVDFGLARILADLERDQTVLRGMGELHFAAPEQLGSARSKPAMDLYALGATFFYLATGLTPPSAAQRVNGAVLDPMGQANPEISPEFEAIITHLMALSPAERPPNAAVVRESIQRPEDWQGRPAAHAAPPSHGARPVAGPPSYDRRLVAAPPSHDGRPVAAPPSHERKPVAWPPSQERRPAPKTAADAPSLGQDSAAVSPPDASEVTVAAERPTEPDVVPGPPFLEAPTEATPEARRGIFSLRLPWFGKNAAVATPATPADAATSAPPETDLTAFPYIDLASLDLDRETGLVIPETIAKRIQGVCIGRPVGKQITLVVKDPTQIYIYDHINYTTQGMYKPVLMRAEAQIIDLAHEFIYKISPRMHHVPWHEWLEKKKFAGAEISVIQADDVAAGGPDLDVRGPAIEAVDRIIKEAISIRASDIHIETYETEVVLRYRIDGVLHVMDTWPRREAAAYVKRIKIMAEMDIAQDRVTQGGRISVRVSDREFDLRVSCVPVPDGESIVMRLLSKGTFTMKLEDLGLAAQTLDRYRVLVEQPNGMLLISGPTGSGKSTTLYATLAEINRPDRKILTVEDPIEYKMPGVVQVQVHMAPREEEKRLTFARALREFLRQDPDVILVGEIRDDETAAISVQAALTGHLLLSTIHTNDAVGIITRLRDRNIEPFLLASTLIGGVAQRLVRTICEDCKEGLPVPAPVQRMFEKEAVPDPRLFRGRGCRTCHGTGYRGRIAIYEVLALDSHLRDMIAQAARPAEMQQYARSQGMKSLLQDGLSKVVEGRVSLEEVQRVCMSM